MMYAKIKNNTIVKCPFTVADLRSENPNVSFPSIINDELMLEYGAVKVVEAPVPEFDRLTQSIEREVYLDESNICKSRWKVVPQSLDIASNIIRSERNRLLTACDWTQLPDVSSAVSDEWAIYRQALRDVTSQLEFPWNVTWPTPPGV